MVEVKCLLLGVEGVPGVDPSPSGGFDSGRLVPAGSVCVRPRGDGLVGPVAPSFRKPGPWERLEFLMTPGVIHPNTLNTDNYEWYNF